MASQIVVPTLRQLVSHAAEAWKLVREALTTTADEITALQDDVTDLQGAVPSAVTVDADGTMPAAAYRDYIGAPPTRPTTAPPSLAYASGTWSEATVNNVSATRGPTVSNLTYTRCHSLGHVTAGTVMRAVVLLPGFGGSGTTEFPASFMRSLADMGFLVIRVTTQGRGTVSGSLHYQPFETQAVLDLLAAAVTAATSAGATIYGGGRCAWFLSSSTGAIDLGLMLQRCPEAVLGGTILYGNPDLLRYHELVSGGTLTALEAQLAVLGAREPAALDYYTAVNLDAVSRVLALPECTARLYIGGDSGDVSVPIPDPADFVRVARGEHGSRDMVSYRITSASDPSNERIQHNGGIEAAGVTLFNYGWVQVAAAATEWRLPVAFTRLRAQGWFRRLAVTGSADPANDRAGVEVWLSPSTDGLDDANAGRALAADVSITAEGLVTIEPVTSTSGFAEVLSGVTARVVPLEPKLVVDLAAPPEINTLADLLTLGIDHFWVADKNVTGGGTITAWAEEDGFGSITLAAASNNPASATDSDGVPVVRFTAASSQKLIGTGLPFSPRANHTAIVVYSIPSAAAGQIVNLTHQGTFDTLSLNVTASPVEIVYYRNNTYAVATAGGAGVGGHSVTTATKHVSAWRRVDSSFYESLDLGTEHSVAIATDTFLTTGTNHITVGAGLANSGSTSDPFEFFNGDVYAILTAPIALSPAEIAGVVAYLRRRLVFGAAPATRTPVGAPSFEVDKTIHDAAFTARLHTAHQVDLSSGTIAAAIPDPATCEGHELMISQVVAGTSNLTITPSTGLIEGAASFTIAGLASGAGLCVRLCSHGSAAIGWKVTSTSPQASGGATLQPHPQLFTSYELADTELLASTPTTTGIVTHTLTLGGTHARTIAITTTSHSGTYVGPWTISGMRNGVAQSESFTVLLNGGMSAVNTVKTFDPGTVTVARPAQNNALGAYTITVGDGFGLDAEAYEVAGVDYAGHLLSIAALGPVESPVAGNGAITGPTLSPPYGKFQFAPTILVSFAGDPFEILYLAV